MIDKQKLIKIGCYAGISLIFVFAALFLLAILNYPGYSLTTNYLSDLGIGEKSAVFFNSALVASGFLGILFGSGAFILFEERLGRIGAVFLIVANIALIGTGIFTLQNEFIHTIFSGIFFLLTAFAWLIMGTELRKEHIKIGYFSISVGAVILISLITGLPPILEHVSVLAMGANGVLVAAHLLRKI